MDKGEKIKEIKKNLINHIYEIHEDMTVPEVISKLETLRDEIEASQFEIEIE